jgi:hypothetical protein
MFGNIFSVTVTSRSEEYYVIVLQRTASEIRDFVFYMCESIQNTINHLLIYIVICFLSRVSSSGIVMILYTVTNTIIC